MIKQQWSNFIHLMIKQQWSNFILQFFKVPVMVFVHILYSILDTVFAVQILIYSQTGEQLITICTASITISTMIP